MIFRFPTLFLRSAVVVAWLLAGASASRAQAQSHSQVSIAMEGRLRVGPTRTSDDQASAAIRRKLVSIIVPSIEFRSTTVEDAIEFLRQEGRRLDPDPNPQSRGLNINLRLPAAVQTSVGSQPMVQASQTNSKVSPTDPLFDSPVPSSRPHITLAMNRIPLLEALKYVAIQAGLKIRVDPYAVSLVPLAENTDALITAVFRVSPTFIDSKNNGSSTSALDQASTSAQ